MGQGTSLMVTGLGVFTDLFDDHTGKDIPTTLTGGAYFILSATAGPYMACQPGFIDKLKQLWWKFVIIGLSDFYSSYLQTLAFKYTSIPSNMLITAGFYTFFVIILSVFMIKTRYKLIHYASIIISTGGMVIVIWQDLLDNKSAGMYVCNVSSQLRTLHYYIINRLRIHAYTITNTRDDYKSLISQVILVYV